MEFIVRSQLTDKEKGDILELWNNEYPEKLAFKSVVELDDYLANLDGHFHRLLIDTHKKIQGWYFGFRREEEKWFAIILCSKLQGRGFGTKMLDLAKQSENELNGWAIDHDRDRKKNGEVYRSPLNFYLKNGFKKIPNHRLELDKISAVKIRWTK